MVDNKIIYKYLDIDGALAMLKGRNLQFTNATYFNDPFDCHPKLINYMNTPESESGWAPHDFIRDMAENRLENFRNSVWVSCFSKVFDNLLMWAYYSNHKGVCVGMNRDMLANYIDASLGLMAFGSGIEVEYKDIIDRPDYYKPKEDLLKYQICTKGLQWAHEQEVRLAIIEPSPWVYHMVNRKTKKGEVIDWKEVRFYPIIGPECFDSVYLGCRIDEEDKERIINLIKTYYPKVSVFQMSVNPDRFGLDAQLIEI